MELLREIYDNDVIGKEVIREPIYRLRKGARAILKDASNKIAVLFVSKDNYHKLPGGGVEIGESIDIALKREAKEEVGVDIEVTGEVGVIIEYRDQFNQIQISYCFTANVVGEYGTPDFTQSEKEHGFELKWVTLEEALSLMEDDLPANYVGKFIRQRDLTFLKKAISIKKSDR